MNKMGFEIGKQDKNGGGQIDGWEDSKNEFFFFVHSVNVSSALLPLIGVPPGWII